jgi:putative SOS response-associated peptidase YedK
LITPVHDRMPVMLAESAWDEWLDPEADDAEHLASLLVPIPDTELEIYPVSTRVNRPVNNDAGLLERVPVGTGASGDAGSPLA